MFTGIVEERGTVAAVGAELEVRARKITSDSGPGASVAVNGVCLTVVERRPEGSGDGLATLVFDVSDETRRCTSLGRLAPGDVVNLERPVTLLARLGGHLVQGHVDAVGRVAGILGAEVGCEMTFEVPADLMRYLVEKGSVTVDGVSLTVAVVDRSSSEFTVALVPFTLEATNLGGRRVGDPVNVETDVLAKYVEGLVKQT